MEQLTAAVKWTQKLHFEGEATGNRKADHPKVYTDIHLEFVVEGDNVNPESVEKAVKYSEEKYCPVWAMLRQITHVTSAVILTPAPTQDPVS